MAEKLQRDSEYVVELDLEDPIVRACNRIILQAVRGMSVFIVVVIWFSIIDAGYSLFIKIVSPPFFILDVSDLLDVFAVALVVLIAFEI